MTRLTRFGFAAALGWLLMLCASVQAATVEVSPTQASVGARIVVDTNGLTGGSRYRIYLERGRPALERFLLQDFVASSSRNTGKYSVPANAQSAAHSLVLYRVSLGEVTEDATPFTVQAGLTVVLTPTSAEPGKSVRVNVSGARAGSMTIVYAGSPVLGPVSVGDTGFIGKFIVPRDRPASLPASVTVRAENRVGRSIVATGQTTFNALAPSGIPRIRSTFTQPPPVSGVEGLRLPLSGRVQQPDGTRSNGQASFFWRGPGGRTVPISGVVQTAADGTYSAAARAPSFFMDGVGQAGNGSIFAVVRDTDPDTEAPRDTAVNTGNEFVSFNTFVPQDGQLLIKLVGTSPLGGLDFIDGAYVEVLGGFDDAFSDPNDGVPPPSEMDILFGGRHQLTPQQEQSGSGILGALGINGCPLSFSRKITDAVGEAPFEYDAEQLRHLLILQSVAALGEVRTTNVGLPIPGIDVMGGIQQPGRSATKGNFDGQSVNLVLRVHAGQQGYGETGEIDDDNNPATPKVLGYQPTDISIQLALDTGEITLNSGPQFGGSATVLGSVIRVQLPSIPLLADNIEPYNPRVQGLKVPAHVANKLRFEGMHSYPDTGKWPDASFAPRNVGRQMRFGWEAGFGAITEATLYLKLPGSSQLTAQASFVIDGDTACNVSGVSDYVASLPDMTRWPLPANGNAACVPGKITIVRSIGQSLTSNFELCTTAPPGDANVLEPQVQSLLINAILPRYSGTMDVPQQSLRVDRAEMREYEIPPQDNVSANSGDFVIEANSYGAFKKDADMDSGHVIGSNATDPVSSGGALFGFADNVQTSANIERLTILDTGRIPLFRYPWGAPPIAGATLGADFWLGSDLAFYGRAGVPNSPNIMDASIDPRLEGGVNMFFDLDILFGLVSASVTASPSIGLTLRDVIGNGGLFPNQTQQSGTCFNFDLDVTMEICAILCAEDTYNLFSVYEPSSCGNRSGAPLDAAQGGHGAFDLLRPRLLPSALTVDHFGRQLVVRAESDRRLIATHLDAGGNEVERVIASATVGIQHIDVVFLGAARALAVWSESSLTEAAVSVLMRQGLQSAVDDLARAQVLRYAYFDGSSWSAPALVDVAQVGVGKPRLAACKPDFSNFIACGRVSSAFLVWEYDRNRNIAAPDIEIHGAEFVSVGGFGRRVAISATGSSSDMSPDVSYLGSKPIVVWVNNAFSHYSNLGSRALAYRIIDVPDGTPTTRQQVIPSLGQGVGWPSVAALNNSDVVVAYTLMQDAQSPFGNRNALFAAKGRCGDEVCTFTRTEPRDPAGRQIRGERPLVDVDGQGDPIISFRGLAFGPDALGVTGRATDPPGMLLGSGEHIVLRIPSFTAATTEVAIQALSFDGLQHWRPDFAFDLAMEGLVGISQQAALPVGRQGPMEFAKRFAGKAMPVHFGKSIGTALGMYNMADEPDFRIESLTLAGNYLTAGQSASTSVSVRNAGAQYDPAVDGTVYVRYAWDAPPGAGVDGGQFALPAMPANAEQLINRSVPVPAGHFRDERRTLFVEVVTSTAFVDANSEDNSAQVSTGAMPVPQDLRANIKVDSPIIGLDWTAPVDPRINGYRIYKRAENGTFVPYGSSPTEGFADFFAGFSEVEQYRVTSYSERGIESELSEIIEAEPVQGSSMFANGFETP